MLTYDEITKYNDCDLEELRRRVYKEQERRRGALMRSDIQYILDACEKAKYDWNLGMDVDIEFFSISDLILLLEDAIDGINKGYYDEPDDETP